MKQRQESSTKDRVLWAALKEFAARGYEAASTNAIAAEAGVAKGLVFHHFGSKEQLFLAVFEHVLHEVKDALLVDMDALPTDLFERLFAWHLRKIALIQERPEVFEFFMVVLSEAPVSLQATMRIAQERALAPAWPAFLQGVDGSRLKPDISVQDAMETLKLLTEGLEKHILAEKRQGVSIAQVAERAWVHFARLRDGLYRLGP